MADQKITTKLTLLAKQMVAPGKGILAADESIATIDKRFAPISLANTEENRRAFRTMLLTTKDMGRYISGVILFDETIRQKADNGKRFVEILEAAGVLPGIKVDEGLFPMPSSPTEKLTKGLDTLDARLQEYAQLGATFCKWRSVITVSEKTPTDANIQQNAHDLASYASICQKNGLVPMVEPEVLMEGSHTRLQSREASRKILTALFTELEKQNVSCEGLILKTSMVVSGKDSGELETPNDVARETVALFKEVLPNTLPGEAFLSGGQSELQATANLNAMHQLGTLPWPLTFSFARALQDSATKTWAGKAENVAAAQKVFLHRAKMNSLASQGAYTPDMEKELS